MFKNLYKLLILYSLIFEDFFFFFTKELKNKKFSFYYYFLKLFKAFVLWKIDGYLGNTGLEGDKKFSYDDI